MSRRAVSSATPFFNRANTGRKWLPRDAGSSFICSGTNSSARPQANSGGITPITSYGSPSSNSFCPMAAGDPLKRRAQKSWLSTATLGPPDWSSSGLYPRPSLGRTPSTSKNEAVVRAARRRTGSPAPVSTYDAPVAPPTFSKTRLRSTQS